jgi:hypothetical protein
LSPFTNQTTHSPSSSPWHPWTRSMQSITWSRTHCPEHRILTQSTNF